MGADKTLIAIISQDTKSSFVYSMHSHIWITIGAKKLKQTF